MSQRFFVENPIRGDAATLSGDEAHHLSRVMRASAGDEIVLFDGSGAEFAARITRVDKSAVEVQIIARREVDREPPHPLTLAVALPKGERQKWLVEKVTELGVARLVPLVTERGVAEPVDSALVRLRRTVIEACKQCGRNRLMEIGPPQAATDFFREVPTGQARIVADPLGTPLTALCADGPLTAAVGPEGGFTSAELAVAVEHGWLRAALGRSILRVETAAVAIAAWSACR